MSVVLGVDSCIDSQHTNNSTLIHLLQKSWQTCTFSPRAARHLSVFLIGHMMWSQGQKTHQLTSSRNNKNRRLFHGVNRWCDEEESSLWSQTWRLEERNEYISPRVVFLSTKCFLKSFFACFFSPLFLSLSSMLL